MHRINRPLTFSINFFLVCALLMAAVFLGLLVTQGYFKTLFLGILLVVVAGLIFSNPKTALVLITLSVFSFEYLAGQGILPTAGIWAVDGLVIMLLIRLMLINRNFKGRFWTGVIFKLFLAWLLLVLASAVVNLTSPIQVIVGLRVYVRFILLYYCLLEYKWEPKFLKGCLILIVFLILLQLPVVFLQFNAGINFDGIAGTITDRGGTGELGMIAVSLSVGLVAYAIINNNLLALLLGMLILFVPIMGAARIFFFIIPFMLVFAFIRLPLKNGKWQFFIVLLGVSLLVLNWDLIGGRNSFGTQTIVDAVNNPEVIIDELLSGPATGTEGATIGRIAGLQLAWNQISGSVSTFLLGYGPGAAQGSRFSALQSQLFETLAQAGGRASQLSRSLLEWGILGTLMYALIFGVLWYETEKCFRNLTDPFWKASALGHITLTLLGFFLVAYTATWSATASTFLVWFVGGVLQNLQTELIELPESSLPV